ncbi:hypothetical protein M0766_30260 (plasmid) [Pseudomonas putida]|nr:hypothetical protein M0766_30260 [Pseudomonas putida]
MSISESQARLFTEELSILASFTWGFLKRTFLMFCCIVAALVIGGLLSADPEVTTFKDFLIAIQSTPLWFSALILAMIVSVFRTLYVQRKKGST